VNSAVWRQAWGDQKLLLVALALLWSAFPWLYLWLQSQVPMGDFQMILNLIPPEWQKLSGVRIADVGTPAGRVALAFVDPVVVLGATVWGVTRGSDIVAGPLERGTLEMVLAAPVRRATVYFSHAAATIAGGAVVCAVLMVSMWSAIAFGPWSGKLVPLHFMPAAFNVFGLMTCMAGLAALVSSVGNHRARVIGIMGAFYVVSLLAKVVGRMSEQFGAVGWLSVFNAFEPQQLVSGSADAWRLMAGYDAILIGIGLAAFIAGGIIFARRDLPAPL